MNQFNENNIISNIISLLTILGNFFNSKPLNGSPIDKEEEGENKALLFDEQSAILDRALIKEPENPTYYFEKATLFFNGGYWLESLALLEKAIW